MECLVGFGASLAAKCSEYTVESSGSQFGELGFIFYHKTNLDNLRTQVQQLGLAKERLQHSIDEAKRNCEEIEASVNDWLVQADNISAEANNLLRDEGQGNTKCCCGCFPNLVSRSRLSKKAVKMASEISEFVVDAGRFDKVSYRIRRDGVIENKGFVDFESRMSTLEGIMEALRDSGVSMIGVYGVAGVGKTMLAKEVGRRAVEEKIFSEVVVATVSQTPNHENIQQEVAEKLGLEFREKSVSVRANRLQCRLRQEEKTLIILDDIWENLELDEVGISFGDAQKGCKILLTSRFRNVLCDDMGAEKNFQVGPLSDNESTSLFKQMVGDLAEKPDFRDLAAQIVEKCGGLPATIAKVASDLKNKSLYVWKNVLTQLQRSIN
ncbi:hypothetical protein TIFTF001_000741 [Ficus carica]|uniref:NB-ARC domain-containing protein n=1 Tax=Ficus carica TaxID=3494 RepID=A0AA88CPP8_FICCA|nr:hypothetical protein TIFTF001_000741 [Ficus carica]